ncbi:MAG TPA: carboxypeptidase-like regulatory domain-containing protein [Vicinamibacterales bacterium]|jgi:hypothetical protein
MIRTLLVAILAIFITLTAVPVRVVAGQTAPATGLISGTAHSQAGQVLVNTTVRLRSLVNQQIIGTTTSNTAGGFTFTGLTPGQYMVEAVNAAGQVVGTSSAVTLTAASMVATGVGVTAAVAAAAAAGGFLGSTLGLLTLAGVGSGVAGLTVAATRKPVSPSQ